MLNQAQGLKHNNTNAIKLSMQSFERHWAYVYWNKGVKFARVISVVGFFRETQELQWVSSNHLLSASGNITVLPIFSYFLIFNQNYQIFIVNFDLHSKTGASLSSLLKTFSSSLLLKTITMKKRPLKEEFWNRDIVLLNSWIYQKKKKRMLCFLFIMRVTSHY